MPIPSELLASTPIATQPPQQQSFVPPIAPTPQPSYGASTPPIIPAHPPTSVSALPSGTFPLYSTLLLLLSLSLTLGVYLKQSSSSTFMLSDCDGRVTTITMYSPHP